MVCCHCYWAGRSRSQRLCLLWPAKKQRPTERQQYAHEHTYAHRHTQKSGLTSPNSPAVLVTVTMLNSPSVVWKVLTLKLTTPWGSSLLSIIMVALPLVSEMAGGTKRLGSIGGETRPQNLVSLAFQ